MTQPGSNIYAVTTGEYSDYCIIRVFANEADAEEYRAIHNYDAVEIWEVEQGPVLTAPKYQYYWISSWTMPESTAKFWGAAPPDDPHEVIIDNPPDERPEITEEKIEIQGGASVISVKGWNKEAVKARFDQLVEENRLKEQEEEGTDNAWF